MGNLSQIFYRRIGLNNEEVSWTPAGINKIIAYSQLSLPFDNLSVFNSPDTPFTRAYVEQKILTKGQGGLCYELNSLFYEVMKENGVSTSLITATVYDNATNDWLALQETHVLSIIHVEGNAYLVDIGLGLKSPRVIVPLNGRIVTFQETQYQVTKDVDFYYFNFKQAGEQNWNIGYRFATNYSSVSLGELEINRQIITFDNKSPFNKGPLIAIFTTDGSRLLTPSNYTITDAAGKTKYPLSPEVFKELAREFTFPLLV
ncbi:arylamine N-acetyltransferase family protein [Serratia sp. UGAL515B_01]|uniref:arylamine N-acetyltransferase family protein n=1 Tax=Serratia sp. UGAL515B_01 TaxID=2986763 RepID=UPI0029541D12|nr:arylamine N-acetyltransferase [Serratia sp. UGAL515B_01]WON77658.1 arylamine N-acetyltransferase [Serratia sp. UGAL515B_01]